MFSIGYVPAVDRNFTFKTDKTYNYESSRVTIPIANIVIPLF